MSSAGSFSARASRWASQKPTAMAVAIRIPYQRIEMGPNWIAIGPGETNITLSEYAGPRRLAELSGSGAHGGLGERRGTAISLLMFFSPNLHLFLRYVIGATRRAARRARQALASLPEHETDLDCGEWVPHGSTVVAVPPRMSASAGRIAVAGR